MKSEPKPFHPTLQDELNNARRQMIAERTRHGRIESSLAAFIASKDAYIRSLHEQIQDLREAYTMQIEATRHIFKENK